jgi:cytochrome oxidase Cu insertion factor (SCO1/SenC/PrrC family)
MRHGSRATLEAWFGRVRLFVATVLAWCMIAGGMPPIQAQTTLPPIGAQLEFTLTTADGASVTTQSFRGKWLVVYFGYTFCPDVCPTTLMEIAGALKALGPRAEALQALFVTIDPRRDTPEVLREYVKSFDPRLVGLTGTPAQVAFAAYEASLVDDPKRLRSFSGAAQAAAVTGNSDKARYYFARMVEMADAGSSRPELLRARAYLAGK